MIKQQVLEADALEAADQLVEVMVELGPDIGIQRRGADALVEADRGQQVGGHREVGAGHFLFHQFRGRLLVGRIGEGIHEADRHRLHAFLLVQGDGLLDLRQVERRRFLAVTVQPSRDAGAQVARHQRFDVGVAVVVLLLADAAAHFQGVAHTFGGQQAALGAGAGQRGVGGHRGAVHDGVDGRREGFQRHRRIHARRNVGQAVDHRDRRDRTGSTGS
jgi:hypothetical protein